MTTPAPERSQDQAFLPAFRLTLVAQGIAALGFGIVPLVATSAYASAISFPGNDPLIFRLGGAATTGYLAAPLLALAWRAGWREVRIPALATLTFTLAALGASAWERVGGARQPIVIAVVAAGAVFSIIAAFWIRHDQAPPLDPGRPLESPARIVIILATLSAATFGLLPLLLPGPFATIFGITAPSGWVSRIAGAACLGYATGGIASLRAGGYRPMRIQNLAAITFNALGATSAWISVIGGGGGWLAPVVAVAASFFTVALIAIERRYA